jgi:hypothetical protein
VNADLSMRPFTPRPCAHESRGRPHRTFKALVRCVVRNGSPGFQFAPVERLPSIEDVPDVPHRPFPDDEMGDDE